MGTCFRVHCYSCSAFLTDMSDKQQHQNLLRGYTEGHTGCPSLANNVIEQKKTVKWPSSWEKKTFANVVNLYIVICSWSPSWSLDWVVIVQNWFVQFFFYFKIKHLCKIRNKTSNYFIRKKRINSGSNKCSAFKKIFLKTNYFGPSFGAVKCELKR